MTKEELDDSVHTFVVRIVRIVNDLSETRLCRYAAGQLIRCGTSPAPNDDEAYAAESSRDFSYKLSIFLKVLRGSRVWIRILV